MKHLQHLVFTGMIFLSGCADTPTPQSGKEVQAKTIIEQNRDDAQRARQEYLALQQKRAQENPI